MSSHQNIEPVAVYFYSNFFFPRLFYFSDFSEYNGLLHCDFPNGHIVPNAIFIKYPLSFDIFMLINFSNEVITILISMFDSKQHIS